MKISQTNGNLFTYYNNSITETVAHLARCGFHYMDVSFFTRFVKGSRYWGDPQPIADEYHRAFENYGMTPIQSHEPAGNSLGDDGGEYYMKKTPLSMQLASMVGCQSITVHPGCSPVPLSPDECIVKNAEALKKLIPYAEKYNLYVLLENMPHVAPHTADDLNAILDEVNHPLFGICWDVGHANLCGLDQYTEIKKIGSRLKGVHLHDNVGHAVSEKAENPLNDDLHLPPFYGNINYDSIMNALLAIGYTGAFNFEVDGPMTRPGQMPLSAPNGIARLSGRMTPALREQADTLLYEIGKYILQSYDCYEE